MHEQTRAIHAGREIDPATGAIVPPLHLSTTFERDADGSYSKGYEYIRTGNPNAVALERCLSDLEGGSDAIALPSGMAAAYAIVQSLVPGDRIVAARDLYFGFRHLLCDHFAVRGIETDFVDVTSDAALARAMARKPKILWIETPSNPLLEVLDIERCAAAAHDAGALLVCENTFATPVLQRPFEWNADIVVHSLTKYLGGHSDLMGGAVIVRERSVMSESVRSFQRIAGAVLGPFDAWLALRSIETLPMRVRLHSENAAQVAAFLQRHPAVARVHYPGLPDHPGHAVAQRQMRGGFGGVVSFEVRGGRAEAFAAISRLKLIIRATSLGGTHSLIEHRASIEGAGSRAPESLLRLSAGLEHAEDLVADLDAALTARS